MRILVLETDPILKRSSQAMLEVRWILLKMLKTRGSSLIL